MNTETPGSPDRLSENQGKTKQPYRPDKDRQLNIQYDEEVQAKTDRHAAIENFLIEHDCLQNMDLDHPDIPDRLVEELVDLESKFRKVNADFDLTEKSPKFVTRNAELIWKKLQTKEHESRVAEDLEFAEADAEAAEDQAQSYAEKIAALKSEGKANAGLVSALANDPSVPESERAKLQAFQKIIDLAQTPEDRAIISSRVNSLDLSRLPDPVSFIHHQIFDQGEQKSGVSEATQNRIAKAFGVPRMRNGTVADMENNLDQKVPIINPNTGEIEGYEPAITKDNPIEVRPGITMYVENDRKVYEDAYSGEVFPFEGGSAGRELDKMRLQYLSSRPNLLNSGIEDLMGWNLKNARMPKKHELRKIHETQNLLLGGSRILNADVLWSGEQQQFAHNLLMISQFGETTPHLHSSDQMVASRKRLGLSRSGDVLDIDPEVMAAAGDWLNGHPSASGRGAYDDLQAKLHELFPERVAKPSDPNQNSGQENLAA